MRLDIEYCNLRTVLLGENDVIRFNRTLNESNTTSSSNINDLIGNTCYLFGVRGYTLNSYGLWTVIW